MTEFNKKQKQEKGIFSISQLFHTYMIEKIRELQDNSKTLVYHKSIAVQSPFLGFVFLVSLSS